MHPVLAVAAALIVLKLAAELALSACNRAEVKRHAGTPPPAAAAIMDGATYGRSVAYTLAKSSFGDVEQVFDAVVLAAVVFSGMLPRLYAWVAPWGSPGAVWSGAAFIMAAGIMLSIPSLPFEVRRQFRLEAQFGFNRSTPRLWVADKLKGLGLMLVLGFPLLWALLALAGWTGRGWWIWGAALLFGFQLAMMVLYPMIIQPLFNKLQPLPEGPLRTRLLSLGDRTGFRAAAIEVMDGSKRSAHSNAYFTGFGRFRRIVLFDTLVEQLSAEELEAVLAHEIGHYRLRHIPKMLATSAVAVFGGFAALAWLARSAWFNPAFGFPSGQLAPSFLLFGLLSGLVTFWFAPILNWVSRKHEYEADAFAREAVGGAAPMVSALRALAQKNLSNLTPHPWFSAFFYSHPTLVERERALSGRRIV